MTKTPKQIERIAEGRTELLGTREAYSMAVAGRFEWELTEQQNAIVYTMVARKLNEIIEALNERRVPPQETP